jgi:hypothetical protein
LLSSHGSHSANRRCDHSFQNRHWDGATRARPFELPEFIATQLVATPQEARQLDRLALISRLLRQLVNAPVPHPAAIDEFKRKLQLFE